MLWQGNSPLVSHRNQSEQLESCTKKYVSSVSCKSSSITRGGDREASSMGWERESMGTVLAGSKSRNVFSWMKISTLLAKAAARAIWDRRISGSWIPRCMARHFVRQRSLTSEGRSDSNIWQQVYLCTNFVPRPKEDAQHALPLPVFHSVHDRYPQCSCSLSTRVARRLPRGRRAHENESSHCVLSCETNEVDS